MSEQVQGLGTQLHKTGAAHAPGKSARKMSECTIQSLDGSKPSLNGDVDHLRPQLEKQLEEIVRVHM